MKAVRLPEPTSTAPVTQDDVIWHTLPVGIALDHLATGFDGLSASNAEQRLRLNGANELDTTTRESAWRTLAAQFQNVLVVLLLVA